MMLRIAALLMVPFLLADPATATVLQRPLARGGWERRRSQNPRGDGDIIRRQALAPISAESPFDPFDPAPVTIAAETALASDFSPSTPDGPDRLQGPYQLTSGQIERVSENWTTMGLFAPIVPAHTFSEILRHYLYGEVDFEEAGRRLGMFPGAVQSGKINLVSIGLWAKYDLSDRCFAELRNFLITRSHSPGREMIDSGFGFVRHRQDTAGDGAQILEEAEIRLLDSRQEYLVGGRLVHLRPDQLFMRVRNAKGRVESLIEKLKMEAIRWGLPALSEKAIESFRQYYRNKSNLVTLVSNLNEELAPPDTAILAVCGQIILVRKWKPAAWQIVHDYLTYLDCYSQYSQNYGDLIDAMYAALEGSYPRSHFPYSLIPALEKARNFYLVALFEFNRLREESDSQATSPSTIDSAA